MFSVYDYDCVYDVFELALLDPNRRTMTLYSIVYAHYIRDSSQDKLWN